MPDSAPKPWVAPDPLPGPTVTDRLVIRRYELGDAEALFRAIEASRESLHPWLPWARSDHRTLEDSQTRTEAFLRGYQALTDGDGDDVVLAIFDHGGTLVGGTGYHRIDRQFATAEVGYWIHVDHRRRGYCTEATHGVISAGFADWGFRRIHIQCSVANEPSAAVPRRLGLRHEATFVRSRWDDTIGWNDQLSFAVLADEWNGEANATGGPTP